MDPVIEAFCRVKAPGDIRPDVLRRWQTYFRDVIAPALEARQDAPTEIPVRRGRREAQEDAPCV